jgi:putative NIF3 family GTP cyclohydrolase 1 type 2
MKTKLFIILLLLSSLFISAQSNQPKTPEEVVNLIKKNVTCDWATQTVDNFKTGDPNTRLKGIAVCMFADMQTLKTAVEKSCNFIITHEPVFYNHLDETASFANDPVYQEKAKFIKDNNLVIFRFHDHIHMTKPDGISVGMIDKLGLKDYSVNGSLTHFKVPEKTVAGYAKELKKKFDLESIRTIGNPEMKFTKVAFMAGAPGGQRHIQMLQNPDVEVIIAGEAPEWETYLYTNDAAALGKNKAVIFLGHIKSEEAGMEYCAEWLGTFVSGVPIHFIENKPNFVTF